MAKQLVYTSAPALLEAGRSGFGTVARHESIRPALQAELERISQFSREHGQSKDRVLFYHRVMDLRGEHFHVLSRIRDAGADYTGRTNHIAHHIVLTDAEAAGARDSGCTPVDVILWLTEHNLWRDQWHEPARLINEEIAVGSLGPKVELRPNEGAVTWGEVTGSAANAAILAPGGAAAEGCWILCGDEQARQILPLIGESLRLHPDPWAISFSTDTQPTDRIEEIRWRGVSIGSPLERTARESVRPCLDLGSPATLPTPVEQFAGEAKTGLKKAPPPVSAHRGEKEKVTAPVVEQVFQDEALVSATVSLSERMKKKGSQPKATTGSKGKPPGKGVLPVVIGMVAVLILLLVGGGFYVWENCVLKPDDITTLQGSTKFIIKKITEDQGSTPPGAWFNSQIQPWTLGDFQFVSPAIKASVTKARNELTSLQEERDPATLAKKIKEDNQQGLPGLQGVILSKINEVKEAADARKAQEEQARKAKEEAAKLAEEKKRAEKIAKDADEKRKKAEADEKVAKEASAKSTPQQATASAKITSITFKALGEHDSISLLFPGGKLPANTVGWLAKDVSASPLEATNGLDTNAPWQTSPPSATNMGIATPVVFKRNLQSNALTAFATKDQSNAVAVTILYKPGQVRTNATGAFYWNKDSQSFEINDSIKYFKELATQGGSRITYSILKVASDPKDNNLNRTADSLSKLNDQIESEIKNLRIQMDSRKQLTLQHPKNKPPEDQKENYDRLENAGIILYSQLKPSNPNHSKQDPVLQTFSDWLKLNGRENQKTEANYKEYLKKHLAWTERYFNEKNSNQRFQFAKLQNRGCLSNTNSINICFDELKRECENYEKNKREEGDNIFISNLKKIFSIEIRKCSDYFDPKPPEDPKPQLQKKINDLQGIRESIKKEGNSKEYKPQIQILDSSNNPILIFTTP